MEARLERLLFATRWLMAPMYVGLIAVLAMMIIVFIRQVLYYIPQAFTMTGETAIVATLTLTLIDLTLAANLLLIVIFSGYENFVSKLDLSDATDRPAWMGTVDFSGLKMKLIASIVAISAIDLLKRFMEIGRAGTPAPLGDREIFWLVCIHVVFVISGVLLALMDLLIARSGKKAALPG